MAALSDRSHRTISSGSHSMATISANPYRSSLVVGNGTGGWRTAYMLVTYIANIVIFVFISLYDTPESHTSKVGSNILYSNT